MNNLKKISVLTLAFAAAVVAAQAQILVDPLTGALSGYTQTVILRQNANAPLSFQSGGSGATVTGNYVSGGSGSAQQDLFLRNDFSLSVGQLLMVSIVNSGTSLGTSSANADFGIAIASQVNPASAVWTTGTASSRSNYLAMYIKPGSSGVGLAGFNGTTQVTGSGSFTPSQPYNTINGLWISETAANVFSVGYATTTGQIITQASGLTFTGPDIGQAIGLYGDVRSSITSAATLYNLEIVPEPSTLALCGMGVVGLVGMARRKK